MGATGSPASGRGGKDSVSLIHGLGTGVGLGLLTYRSPIKSIMSRFKRPVSSYCASISYQPNPRRGVNLKPYLEAHGT